MRAHDHSALSCDPTRVEEERYELFEGPRYRFELDRRGFVKTFSAGLLVLRTAAPGSDEQDQQTGAEGLDEAAAIACHQTSAHGCTSPTTAPSRCSPARPR